MAFFNKAGTMLRNTVSAQSALGGQTSMFNAIRFMSTKLYVGGLSYGINDESLKEAFANFGDVEFARVIVDRESGRSKGFGFVNFHNAECANAALSAMNGQELNGRNILVSYAQERAPRTGFGGSGGYGGGNSGGYGGGNSGGYGGGYGNRGGY